MDIKTIEAGLLASSFRGSKGNGDSMTITISEHKLTSAEGTPKLGITLRIGHISEERVLLYVVENRLYFRMTNIKEESLKLCRVKNPKSTNRYVHVGKDFHCKALKRFIGTWNVKKEIVDGTMFYYIADQDEDFRSLTPEEIQTARAWLMKHSI